VSTVQAAAVAPPRTDSLLAAAFRPLWLLTFLVYGFDALLRALVPVIALDRGGDAVFVGLLGAAFAIPSVIFRPIVGTLIDSWQHRRLHRAGTAGMALLPLLLLIPTTLPMLASRFLYGTAWAVFSVSNHAVLARLAPSHRRAQAAAGYLTAGAIGVTILSPLGIRLYTSFGDLLPILFVVALGAAAVTTAFRLAIPTPDGRSAAAGSAANPGRAPAGRPSLITRLVEPAALPGTTILVLAYSSWSIFTIFPSIYARRVGEPVEALAPFFLVWGLFQVLPQPFAGRLGDHLGRARSLVLGAAVAAVALLIALSPTMIAGPAFVTFTVAGALYATAQSLVMATVSALTMERAPAGRLGSAMATYSLGYQVATGLSSLLWGAVITTAGFDAVFWIALAFQAVSVLLVWAFLGQRGGPGRARPTA
jgi:MFS family permease